MCVVVLNRMFYLKWLDRSNFGASILALASLNDFSNGDFNDNMVMHTDLSEEYAEIS